MAKGIKLSDTDQFVTRGSKADSYWNRNPYEPYYAKLRPGLKLPPELRGDLDKVLDKFQIKAVGFGNWLSVEDRINYVNAMIVAFYDLNKVLGFNYNVGIHKNLSVAFGARGSGGALAHYEPANQIINITRYKRGDEHKAIRFLGSGGVGSFAHEYGHFLDYFAGQYLDKSNTVFALTDGRSVSRGRVGVGGPIRQACDDLMEEIIWKEPGKELSSYYKRLLKFVEAVGKGDYFLRRNEIFARAFEVYAKHELGRRGIKNAFLTDTKYDPYYYLKESEMEKVAPKFRKLIKLIKDDI